MTCYRVVCIVQQPMFLPTTHAHIIEVEAIPDGDNHSMRLRLPQILLAMKSGDDLYTIGEQSSRIASVEAGSCPNCGGLILRQAWASLRISALYSAVSLRR